MKTAILSTIVLFFSVNANALSLAPCTGTKVEIQICQLQQQMMLDRQAHQAKLNALDSRLCVTQFRAAYSNYRDFTCQPMWIAGIAPAGMVSTNNTCLPGAMQGKIVRATDYQYTCQSGKWIRSNLPVVTPIPPLPVVTPTPVLPPKGSGVQPASVTQTCGARCL